MKSSTSFRALSINFMLTLESFKLETKSPCHTTILNWIHKIGYYQLNKRKEKGNDWIIMIDESIQIGVEKILMIYGIQEKNIDFTRSLKLEDMVPLLEKVSFSNSGEEICKALIELKKEIGEIKYAVTDGGPNIKKGLRLAEITHIYDLTHKIALILENKYCKNETYIEIIDKIAIMKKNCIQTELAYLAPPRPRTKSRYLNICEISKWLYKTLNYYELNKNNEIFAKIAWLLEYKDFIMELYNSMENIKQIEKILKTNGFSKETKKESEMILSKNKSLFGEVLQNDLSEYFNELSRNLLKTKKLLITSDIIESAFGKYKNYVSQNPMACVTNLILCLAAFTFNPDKDDINKALEETGIAKIKAWNKQNIPKSLFLKRLEAYSMPLKTGGT